MEEDVRLTAREVDVLRQLSRGVAYAQAARELRMSGGAAWTDSLKERKPTMLLFVPQGYVALVYENGVLRAVVEAGVGFVPSAGRNLQVQYVDLKVQQEEVLATLH